MLSRLTRLQRNRKEPAEVNSALGWKETCDDTVDLVEASNEIIGADDLP
jgi:hypothetical protein